MKHSWYFPDVHAQLTGGEEEKASAAFQRGIPVIVSV